MKRTITIAITIAVVVIALVSFSLAKRAARQRALPAPTSTPGAVLPASPPPGGEASFDTDDHLDEALGDLEAVEEEF